MSLGNLDLRGLNPAPVTPFTVDGDVDYAALADLGKFLASVDGVKSLVVLGHAGEGTFLTQDEQVKVIETLVNEVGDQVAIVAGITGEGTKVAVDRERGDRGGVQTTKVQVSERHRRLLLGKLCGNVPVSSRS